MLNDSLSYDLSWDHTVLPATWQRWESQAEAGTRFSDPGRMQGWVDVLTYVAWKRTGWNWTRDLSIASATPYRSATTQHSNFVSTWAKICVTGVIFDVKEYLMALRCFYRVAQKKPGRLISLFATYSISNTTKTIARLQRACSINHS